MCERNLDRIAVLITLSIAFGSDVVWAESGFRLMRQKSRVFQGRRK